jgi:hypothetical protein
MTDSRKLSIFLCHASQDKPIVRELYQRLGHENWIDPWLDEEKLLPGQNWDLEIERAVEQADVVIVCLSNHSVSKEGYVQRELKFVLDIALEKPEGTIFVIPLRLDDCAVPRRLRSWQYVDYFPNDHRKRAHQRLIQSLRARHGQLASSVDIYEDDQPFASQTGAQAVEKKRPALENASQDLAISVPTTPPGILDLVASILPILFFAQLAPFVFGQYDDTSSFLLGITALIMAAFLVVRRQMLANRWIKFTLVLFIATHSTLIYSEYRGWNIADFMPIVDGIVALAVGVLYVLNFKLPQKSMPYAASLFAAYIALYGVKLLLNSFSQYPNEIQTPFVTVGFIAAIFLWLER